MKRLIFVFFTVSCGAVYAQNALILPWVTEQFTNTNGTVLANGKVCTYQAGTSTGLASYTDSTATVSNNVPPNAILLDSTGRTAGIWLKAGIAYKIVFMTAGSDNTCNTGVIIKTQDNVFGQAGPTAAGTNTFTGGNTFTPAATSTIANSPSGATESGTTVTITTTATCTFTAGQWVTIAGVTNASYNGIAQVLSPGCNGTASFTFTAGISGFAASGSGTVAPATIFNSGNEFGLMRGNITPTTAAGPTGANNENFLFVSGNCNPTTEYNFIHSQNATDDLAGCIEAPVGGFTPVYNGVAGYATNNLNASANGLYGEARCRVNNSACWGTDTSSRAESGLTGVTLTGAEYEMYPKNTTDVVNGAKVGGDFPIQPTSATAFEVLIPNFLGGTGQWTNGLTVDNGATTGVAVNIGLTAASGNSLGSQKLQFNSKDAGGVVRQPSINSDLAGNIFLNVTSGGQSVVVNGAAATLNVPNIINPSGTPLAVPTVGNNVISDTATQTLTNKTLNVPLSSGTGLQIFNTTTTCTTGASVGATCTTANISLPVAEADTSYRVTCMGKGLTNVPVTIATANASASQFTITIAALTAAAASFASYDCVAGHN